MQEWKIENDSGRIDAYLASITEYSRSKISKMLRDGTIKVNNQLVKNSYQLKQNDIITMGEYVEEQMSAEAEEMDLDILYEDDDIIVVNKANGIVVHPAIGNNHGTLVNGLLHHSKNLSSNNGEFRPGVVHRIDAYTTGLLVIAKNNEAHDFLAQQLKEQKASRKYYALVWGVVRHDTGTIDAPIGRDSKDRKKMCVTATNSKPAITHFKVLERFKEVTLLEVTLKTGRTHQIRVHMDYIGHPIVNDPVYGRRKLIDATGQCLHAKTLGFIHPKTKEYMQFDSELPKCFTDILEKFKQGGDE